MRVCSGKCPQLETTGEQMVFDESFGVCAVLGFNADPNDFGDDDDDGWDWDVPNEIDVDNTDRHTATKKEGIDDYNLIIQRQMFMAAIQERIHSMDMTMESGNTSPHEFHNRVARQREKAPMDYGDGDD